jgi:hypothetical protein
MEFLIKGFSDILLPLLTYHFNLSVTSVTVPSLWKQTAVVAVFNNANSAIVSNDRPTSILTIFAKYFN